MNTNSHILTINAHLGQMRNLVCAMDTGSVRDEMMRLVETMTDEIFGAQIDFAAQANQIAELNKQLFEPVVHAQMGEPCRYIDADALSKGGVYRLEEFEQMLRKACESEARVLGAFLHKYEKIGYLDFHSESKKKILLHLQQCFPTMRNYGYTNFAANF